MTLICKLSKVQVRAFSFLDAHQPLARIPVLTTFHRHREPFESGATLFEPPQTTYSRSNDISPHSELQSLTQRPTQHHPVPPSALPSTTQYHLARYPAPLSTTQYQSARSSFSAPSFCAPHPEPQPESQSAPHPLPLRQMPCSFGRQAKHPEQS